MKSLPTAFLSLLLAACSTSGLGRLMLEGPDLHASLVTREVNDGPVRHVAHGVVQENPQQSADARFVEAIARSASQGRLDASGISSALFALHHGDNDVGLYGLEAASAADADRLEGALRAIWSHNASIDRARVHRRGLVLVVVWTDGVSPGTWEAVNASVARRLAAP